MVVKKNQQKHQGHAQRNLAVLHRLTHTLAKTWDCDKMVKAFLAEIAAVIDADVVGLVKRTPHRLWMRVKPQQCERADAVRSRLMERLEHQECEAGRAKMPCEKRRRRWPGHLSLVSKSNLPPLSLDEQDNNVYEVQLVVSSSVEGLLYIEREPGCAFSGEERQLIQIASAMLSLALTSADAHSRLRELDLRDSLTGVFTRDVLDGVLHRELRAGLRYGGSACLLLLDPDYFRTVNERLGHTAGDAVLKRVASLLEENIRDVDSVSRYSGGAFAVV
ncbi:MAG: GGDEF domain-containing protein, partial [Nitrospira sp.]|nr:GGDEF domain-containing protein [Nitrospira sp.]